MPREPEAMSTTGINIDSMTASGRQLADRFYELLGSPIEPEALAAIYAPEALVIRFNGTSSGLEEISTFLSEVQERHQPYKISSIDQLTDVDDVLMWDALVETDNGLLETTEVLVLDDDGRIVRHVPGIRGYWGQ